MTEEDLRTMFDMFDREKKGVMSASQFSIGASWTRLLTPEAPHQFSTRMITARSYRHILSFSVRCSM